tara:strand:- start:541 stop:837 length:297 start_codon:yes stop_codon:yes gene_type:complete
MIVITNAHHVGGFVMNHNLEGVYWDVGDNEYSLQVSFTAEQKQYVLDRFQDWKHVGEGTDQKQNREIFIFRKVFSDKAELKRLARDLRFNKILLKEVT